MYRNPQIDILLSTYNGEKYLPDQISSIMCQTYENWHLIVRDDGSSDRTLSIIRSYRDRYPGKVTLIEDDTINVGVWSNFERLLEYSTSDYIMFCDQDDVWLPEKIEITYRKLQDLIAKYSDDIPLLVYTDMKVVDQNLSVISNSFWKHFTLNPSIGKSLSRLLVRNVAPGCTMMANRRLRDLSLPFPESTILHDWWLSLLSVSLGKNDYVSEPTVLYRQHGKNIVGAPRSSGLRVIINKIVNLRRLSNVNEEYSIKAQRQAMSLAERYKNLLSRHDFEKISAYVNLSSQNYFMKQFYTVKYGFWWSGTVSDTVLFFIL